MPKKRNKNALTPTERDVIKLATSKAGEVVTLSHIQRVTGISFVKACEIAKRLADKGLIKSNVNELNISI